MVKLGLETWWLGVCCWSKMVYQLQKLAHQLEEQLQTIRSLFQLDVPTGLTSPITPQDKLLILHPCLVLEPDSVGSLSQSLGWTEAQVSLAVLAKWLECPSPRHYPHASVDWKRAEYFLFISSASREGRVLVFIQTNDLQNNKIWGDLLLLCWDILSLCKTLKMTDGTALPSCDVRVLTWAPK